MENETDIEDTLDVEEIIGEEATLRKPGHDVPDTCITQNASKIFPIADQMKTAPVMEP